MCIQTNEQIRDSQRGKIPPTSQKSTNSRVEADSQMRGKLPVNARQWSTILRLRPVIEAGTSWSENLLCPITFPCNQTFNTIQQATIIYRSQTATEATEVSVRSRPFT